MKKLVLILSVIFLFGGSSGSLWAAYSPKIVKASCCGDKACEGVKACCSQDTKGSQSVPPLPTSDSFQKIPFMAVVTRLDVSSSSVSFSNQIVSSGEISASAPLFISKSSFLI